MKRRKKTRFDQTTLGVPVVRCHLADGTPMYFMIDTGSEETLIDMRFVRKHKKEFSQKTTDERIKFLGVHGEKEINILHLNAFLGFKSKNGRLFYVEMKNAVGYDMTFLDDGIVRKTNAFRLNGIIGNTFLRQTNAEINYDTEELIFNI